MCSLLPVEVDVPELGAESDRGACPTPTPPAKPLQLDGLDWARDPS